MTCDNSIRLVSPAVAWEVSYRRIRERDVSADPTSGPSADEVRRDDGPGVVVVVENGSGAVAEDFGDEGSLVMEDQRFAIVPEWVITAEVSDAAFRRVRCSANRR